MYIMKLTKLASIIASAAMIAAPLASHAATTTAFSFGDLIKGSGSTVYYYATNGTRFVFPNEKTYFTWYKDFSTVKQIPDGVLSTIPLGGNVTYRPGVKMVKITTDPKVYVVDQGGFLRHVGSEQLAETLYGLSWKNQIDDIPDAFFVNYKIGTDIQTASDYKPADVTTQTTTIGQDKQFDANDVTISIGTVSNGFVPTTVTVNAGTTVTWKNQDSAAHNVLGDGWTSGNMAYQGTYSHVFNTPGSYNYHDANNTVMQGTVNVQ